MIEFRIGEYFCGPGGLAMGAHYAAEQLRRDGFDFSLRHEWAVDSDPDSCETFSRNVPGAEGRVLNADVTRPDLLDELSDIDGFSFGFPCNDFSNVGERLGLNGKFGGLYRRGVDVLRRFQPCWFVAENVEGLRSAHGGEAFSEILRDLVNAGDIGYDVYPHLYQFEQYGVPQARRRIIVVGIRKDFGEQGVTFGVPSPEMYEHIDTSAETALSRPFPPGVANNERSRQSQTVIDRLKLIDPGENAFNATRMTPELRLKVKGATISQIYRRLEPNLPAYTVTGSGGGGTHMYHWAENRALTLREKARLQTFDDEFVFFGNRTSVRKQIGMAVPVRGAEAIFTALFRTFAGKSYPTVPMNLDVHRMTADQSTTRLRNDLRVSTT